MDFDYVTGNGKFPFDERPIVHWYKPTFSREQTPELALRAREDFMVVNRQLSDAIAHTDTTPLDTLVNLRNHKMKAASLAQDLARIGLTAGNDFFTPELVQDFFGPDTFGPDLYKR